tara:strand:+ start:2443 stop:2544 length:102 start_codon:yes stop_codon:yes gene_type:complete
MKINDDYLPLSIKISIATARINVKKNRIDVIMI